MPRGRGKPMFACYKFCIRTALVATFCCYANLRAYAEESLPPAPTLQNPSSGANLAKFFTSKTPYEFWLACMIGVLGLVIISILIVTLSKVRNIRPEEIARPVIILSVISGTLILVTLGYSNDQIAPAFGLFGTIIGYMLGRIAQSPPSEPRGNAGHPD